MNEWFRDQRSEVGEERSFQAERAERRGDLETAHKLYREAAEAFTGVALSVASDHPNTRSALGIAAVACHARSGNFNRAVEVAHQLLAQAGALSERGRAELSRMARDYGELAAPRRFPTKRADNPRRNQVRTVFPLRGVA